MYYNLICEKTDEATSLVTRVLLDLYDKYKDKGVGKLPTPGGSQKMYYDLIYDETEEVQILVTDALLELYDKCKDNEEIFPKEEKMNN